MLASEINELKSHYEEELFKEVNACAGKSIDLSEQHRIVNECVNRMEFTLPTMHRNIKMYAKVLVTRYQEQNHKNT